MGLQELTDMLDICITIDFLWQQVLVSIYVKEYIS